MTIKNETGYIHSYDPLKGYGFIRREKGKDVFFLSSALTSDMVNGSYVKFDIIQEMRNGKARTLAQNLNKIPIV